MHGVSVYVFIIRRLDIDIWQYRPRIFANMVGTRGI